MSRLPNDRRANPDGRQAFETLRDELMYRLRPVCNQFGREELIQLAVRMTRIRIRYDRDTAVPANFSTR
jgi:hypothetical protein